CVRGGWLLPAMDYW
nr:immunoglobulin heavy chain junction region [Mus musculus]